MEGEERDSTGWSGKLSKEVTCELRPEGHEDLTEGIPRRINSKCKSPGAGMSLTHLGNDISLMCLEMSLIHLKESSSLL